MTHNLTYNVQRLLCWMLFAIVSVGCMPEAARGQFDLDFGSSRSVGGQIEPQVDVALIPSKQRPAESVVLNVTVKLAPDTYTYSMAPGFGGRTRIEVEAANGVDAKEDRFAPDRPPKAAFDPLFGQEIEKYYGQVTWSREYTIKPNTAPADIVIRGTVRYQVCDATSCRPLVEPFQVTLTGSKTGAAASTAAISKQPRPSVPTNHPFEFEKRPVHSRGGQETLEPVNWRFSLSPKDARSGDVATMSITATVDAPFHIFALSHNPKNVGRPTRIRISQLNGLEPIDNAFQPKTPPEIHMFEDLEQRIHHGSITWTQRFEVQSGVTTDGIGLSGVIDYQICNESTCRPGKVEFTIGTVLDTPSATPIVPSEPPEEHAEGGSSLFERIDYVDASNQDLRAATSHEQLMHYLLYAFLGGLILNVMPCVLPVIAIKVMSFVQQAGESRSRIFALNLVYSAGVISVFLILASLAAFAQMGWGGLFQHPNFNLAMAGLVFAMGLSLLGVYEIPIPGFAGSGVGAQQQEGLLGAFMTGILATVLATPCSGPFLGTTLGWSVQQETQVIYLVWTVMGLGMASPYIVFGLAPGLVKWLPRPGNWMVRLKEFAGFVLLGTVIFILSFMDRTLTIPCLVILLGVGLALWMIGNLYNINSTLRRKMTVRGAAIVIAVGMGVFGWGLRNPGSDTLPWQEFSEDALQAAIANKKTVLVDFTADWCATCKTVERFALNTKATRKLLKDRDIVPLKADYTNQSPEIGRWLDRFDSISIPLTAVFSPNDPTRPIIIRDLYTEAKLHAVLDQVAAVDEDGPT